MRRGLLDDVLADLFLAARNNMLLRREIRVSQHVRRHQHVLRDAVAACAR